ncbi:uncharacterized protein Z518_07295 [Rhinocladiella mackenziei CBS 650.93]|uniref:SRR1-like domain-containing protein n=1 Tax=Rhinocladiella mackenziei CBS 650.93 TaxID=1442369 RepID=A0A0D2FNS9_9EURO|nr:uncharacterized protein Z518_07295 [Rhinocladiella mackenziei CBS 650.93]KIX03742.1 hypothetical protein Z518_07295 [Rhinocladiella mackenziei CBS 650.93]
MDFEAHVYCGDHHRSLQGRGLDTTTRATEVSSHIRSLYDAGVPLYSKEIIRDVGEQLRSGSQIISVRGLNGIAVDVNIETGQVFDAGDPDWDFVVGAPFIQYLSIQWLTSNALGYIPRLAYCNLRIFHYLKKRYRSTKEIVSTIPHQSRKQVEEYFVTNKRAWETSEQRRQLQSIISMKTLCHVNKIIAFACGPMAFSDQAPWAIRSAYQHALVITLRDILSELQGHPIGCYAQDPGYTDIDRDVLENSAITILDDPQGFLEVDDSTVVLSFGADIPVRQIIADIARPAMMIWDRSEFFEDELTKSFGTDPDSSRVTKMIRTFYEEIGFPGDLEAFRHVSIYVRHGP